MPATTEKQRRAMAAAAAGKSTLGIPQNVGREFMGYGRNPTPKKSTGGTISGAVGSNTEYRHDNVKKTRNPQTRGMKKPDKAKGGPPKRITTPGKPGDTGPWGANPARNQRAKVAMLREGMPHNPHRGGY